MEAKDCYRIVALSKIADFLQHWAYCNDGERNNFAFH